MALDESWFTEVDEAGGSAFSLKLAGKLHEERSPYQHIEIYETTGFGRLMVIDGYIMLSERDNFLYHEMMSHPALYTHPAPRRVAIVGGGDCGTLREVLKHPEVERVTQVDIDERVTRVAEAWFPQLCERNDDPRAELVFADGIEWMRNREPDSLDVVIVDSTDPIGPALGLFKEDFYRDVRRALGDPGVVVQQSESPLYHMPILKEMHRAMRAAGFETTHTLLYPQPVYPTGWWSATMGAAGVSPERPARLDAAAADALDTGYYSPETHRAALANPPFVSRELTGLDLGPTG